MLSLKSQRGHGHLLLFAALVVAGVGVVGYGVYQKTGVNVANAGLIKANDGATAANGKKSSQTGALVMYGEEGRFKYAKIKAVNTDLKTHRCGNAFDSKGETVVKLKNKGATKLSCSPVANDAIYWVYFGKTQHAFNSNFTIADVDADTCTNIHADPALTSKVTYFANKVCVQDKDTPTPIDATLTVSPVNNGNPIIQGTEEVITYVGIKSTTESFTKEQCAGQVNVTVTGSDNKVAYQTVKPIKQVLVLTGNSYCVTKVKVPLKHLNASTTYTVSAKQGGTPYLHPSVAQPVTFTAPPALCKGAKKHVDKSGAIDYVCPADKSVNKNGFLVLYSEKGRYTYARIKAQNVNTQNHVCGGKFNADGEATVKLKEKTGTQVTCSPIGGVGAYQVAYAKDDKKFVNGSTAVDVDEAYCTFTHPNPALNRKAVAAPGVRICVADRDTPTPIDITLSVPTPNNGKPVTKKARSFDLYVAIKAGESLSQAQCVGQVNVAIKHDVKSVVSSTLPLKYVGSLQGANSFCVAKMTVATKTLSAGTYTISASEVGTAYFKPAIVTTGLAVTK